MVEQYHMPKELDFENLRYCIDNYKANHLFIGLKKSVGGTIKISEDLDNKVLDFRHDNSGLYFLINSCEVCTFPLKNYSSEYVKGFVLEYVRLEMIDDVERLIIHGTNRFPYTSEMNPYDSSVPEPKYSVLRTVQDGHLLEISFHGRIPIKKNSCSENDGLQYWIIDTN
ncbi:MAG: hypothetical protein ACP5N1_07265 [Candidatus Woesearchaeota archaeon]